ncbi:hypothetical protein SDRG_03413 [Saprolegnia diclina VS20]|uniref:Uncharacterized protein n=1 Tax=Saprolegnia diclina (strain VS20) TaxID=1156394 RepID=T0S2K0_SAPDV|nr:hypothetical protein SDRG_03413 [Saprolegnia diclina VS20]EQC39208.1 hypothetical protein SDRG_03413 [Saprolegnia diclina VS20]|eukprot:XP_008607269.1 hypothetical protein SDRG_03413 [Saprolegnia diclina VS20]
MASHNNKRVCRIEDVAVTVLTSPPLLELIASYSDHCARLCPDLYEVLDLDTVDEDWRRLSNCARSDEKYIVASLHKRLVNNGYLGPLPVPDDDDEIYLQYREHLVAAAMASNVDSRALYTALRHRNRIGAWLARLKPEFGEYTSRLSGQKYHYFQPVLFQHDLLIDKTTWGRSEVAAIFGDDDNVVYSRNNTHLGNSLMAHWLNIDDAGCCRLCTLPQRLATLQEDDNYEGGCMSWDSDWKRFCTMFGIHPGTCSTHDWFEGVYNHEYEDVCEKLGNLDEEEPLCAQLIRPLKAYMREHLRDAKIVQIGDCGYSETVTLLVAGLSDAGYLVGAYVVMHLL